MPTFKFSEVSSTNDAARKMIKDGIIDGPAVVWAERQFAGKGRKRRDWFSPAGGLWMTRVLKPRLKRTRRPLYAFLAGVAAVRAVKNVCAAAPALKWPNDILYEGRKLGGILCESSGCFLLIGVGINVAPVQWPQEVLQTGRICPITISEAVQCGPDGWHSLRVQLLEKLNNEISRLHQQTDCEGQLLIQQWKKHSNTLGKQVRIIADDGETVEGAAIDVSQNGSLLVRGTDGQQHSFQAGEVSLRCRER